MTKENFPVLFAAERGMKTMKTIHWVLAVAIAALLTGGLACQKKAAQEIPPAYEEPTPADESAAPEGDDTSMEKGTTTTEEGGES